MLWTIKKFKKILVFFEEEISFIALPLGMRREKERDKFN
jgi:hypothetical protein